MSTLLAERTDTETPEGRAARGKAVRAAVPRQAHASWSPGMRTQQPLALLAEQASGRVPELVPIRYGRMSESPFAFYRGAALPMAADLAETPRTDLTVQLCGDAHLANFGGFASPERSMLFDVNDFDETLPGPFEWDVKRLAASVEVAGRSLGISTRGRRAAVLAGVRAYREAVRNFATMPLLDVWYARLDVNAAIERWGAQAGPRAVARVRASVAKAVAKDQLKARAKLTISVDGRLRFRSTPPLVVPVTQLFGGEEVHRLEDVILGTLHGYRQTLAGDRRHLLDGYRALDLARKVVGVGSVGTRCWIVLFAGRDDQDTLVLQVKEAEPSVLERFVGRSVYDNQGQRVVEGQRLMQAASDVFLGWERVEHGVDGRRHDYYLRQLWDWKLSPAIDTMQPEMLEIYAQLCGWTLARGHARSGDAVAIGSYLGRSDVFDAAIADFASAYADQSELDHRALVDAIATGAVTAALGI